MRNSCRFQTIQMLLLELPLEIILHLQIMMILWQRKLFYQMAKEISQHPEADLIYSDEDIIDIRGNRLFPHFKPDFNPDYLCCVNYICHLVVVKRTLLDRTGLCGQNMTVPRTLIFCFAARSIQTVRRSAIFPKFCITGEAMRVPLRAIRMTSHMQ